MAKVRFGKYSVNLPRNRLVRISIGVLLVLAGGLGGWLPILGFWMLPLGLLVLAADSPAIRRFNRRATVKVVGWWNGRKGKRANGNTDKGRDISRSPVA